MYAMGRLGSYISRGVYTVSAPFHPFGGAVDIIVVEQPDGSFKSSPWYVRFGKFQGVLKSKEKIVRICINDADANFHMYLDHKGEAHFLKEVVFEDEESVVYPSSSSDETEEQSNSKRRQLKSISCNYDAGKLNSADPIDTITSGKIVTRTGSNRERILGLVFGRRSMKEDSGKEEEVGPGLSRTSSLERAELAADLLDVKWSTNLASSRSKKDNTSKLSVCGIRGDRQSYGENGFSNNQTATVSSIKEVKTSTSGATDYPEKQFDIEEVANKRDVLQDCGIATYCETSPISVLDVSCEEIDERLSISSGGHEEVHIHAEAMLRTIEPSAEDMVVKQAEEMELDVEETSKIPESYTRTVSVGQMLGSVKEVKPSCTSSSSDSITQIRVENENDLLPPLRSVSDPQKICGGSEITKSFPTSEASEEEQFLFSDLDEFKQKEQLCIYGDCQSSIGTNGEEGNNSSLDKCVQENVSDDVESSVEKPEVTSDPISIQRSSVFGEKDCWQLGSLPNLWSPDDKLYRPNTCFLSHSLDSKSETLKRISLGVDDSSCMKAGAIEELQSAKGRTNLDDADASVVIPVEESFAGDQSKSVSSSSGNWKLWPFSYRKSNSSKQIAQRGARIPTSDDVVEGPVGCPEGEKDDQGKQLAQVANISENEKADNIEKVRKTEKVKKMAKVMIPTSEQLASLNLKEGNNSVTFTFSTAMLGDQQVHARIFLWKWNTRIVISDVDGTITKSDVLGQFMPLVGRDWSQTGVAHLFSAIKENGYELLFLSARSITQAYHTRRFIVNLKQDGKALPDGPVVISPDGLFPSLYREVIRRAPHEFKIGCLEDIKALFPPDTNPFYAGFGNRDTDEFSYLKVGIPKGKIFIINPKGEVAVHRRIDTKSYTSLHALVHGMFPIRPSSEQEDFNSWNFWKLPPPEIK